MVKASLSLTSIGNNHIKPTQPVNRFLDKPHVVFRHATICLYADRLDSLRFTLSGNLFCTVFA